MLSYIIPFLILILVVVFIHEYGHYYFARRYGVGVTDFSIGFGKELFGWNDKHGTRWKVCAIPLGGYVKFFGDRNVYSCLQKILHIRLKELHIFSILCLIYHSNQIILYQNQLKNL